MTMIIEPKAALKISEDLNIFLADTYTLFLKTQNFHWNVIDPRFSELHKLFEGQYTELLAQVDEIAERIRMINKKTVATMKQYLEISNLEEAPTGDLSGDEMIKLLATDHQAMSKWLRDKIKSTQELGDEGTADLYIQHLRNHDKNAWMLMSHLQRRNPS